MYQCFCKNVCIDLSLHWQHALTSKQKMMKNDHIFTDAPFISFSASVLDVVFHYLEYIVQQMYFMPMKYICVV